jgi:UDP-glucose 4-epimerase
MKRIQITGGAGFVGINLVEYLIKNSDLEISIIDNLSTGNYDLLEKVVKSAGAALDRENSTSSNTVRFFPVDIRDRDKLNQVLENTNFVVHLAAQAGVVPSIKNPGQDAEVNIIGTLNLLEAAVNQGVERLIFASSAAPLGEQNPPLDESKIPHPLSPYGASKLAGEAYCSAFFASFGLNTVALRFSNLYGPNSFHKGSVIAEFMKRILEKQPIVIYGDGAQTRDFLYVKDLCGTILSILHCPPQKLHGETYQLGAGKETSINELVQLIEKVTQQPVSIVHKPARSGEIIRSYTSPKKLEQVFGKQPRTDLETGLDHTWKWFKNHQK